MSVEKRAVHAVNELLLRVPTLDPSILAGDKTPFTDGDVSVYASSDRANRSFVDRVPVQVKGRTVDVIRDRASRQIAKTELAAFQRLRGVVYFLVLFNKSRVESRVFYRVLEPFGIEHALKRSPSATKSIAVEFTPFPEDRVAIEKIFEVASRARRHDASLTINNDAILDAVSLRVATIQDLDFSVPITLDRAGPAFVLEAVAPDGTSTPLDGTFKMWPRNYEEHAYNEEISAGDVAYVGGMKQAISPNEVELRPGPGITLTIRRHEQATRLNLRLTPPEMLSDRLKAVRFFHAAATTGQVILKDWPTGSVPIHIDGEDDLSGLAELLEHLSALDELLRLYDVDTSLISMTEVTTAELQILNALECSRRENPGYRDTSDDQGFVRAKLGRGIILLAKLASEKSGLSRLTSPFNEDGRLPLRWARESNHAGSVAITIYDVIPPEEVPQIVNLRLDLVVDAYEATEFSTATYSFARQFITTLIAAADSAEARQGEFLDAARRLLVWLTVREGALPEHRIDEWQILARSGALDSDVKNQIRELRRDASSFTSMPQWKIALACAILLGDHGDVRFIERGLSETDREDIRTSPLWRLVGESQLSTD